MSFRAFEQFVGELLSQSGMIVAAGGDNLTKVATEKLHQSFVKLLSLAVRTLKHEEVKGQLTAVRCWQIPPGVVPHLAG